LVLIQCGNANACNKHFKTNPDMINKKINASNCLTKTSVKYHDTLSFSLKHAFQNSFFSIKYKLLLLLLPPKKLKV